MDWRVLAILTALAVFVGSFFIRRDRAVAIAANVLFWAGSAMIFSAYPEQLQEGWVKTTALVSVLGGLFLLTCWIGMGIWAPFKSKHDRIN